MMHASAFSIGTARLAVALVSMAMLAACTTPIERVPGDAVVVEGPDDLKGMTREQIEQNERRLADAEKIRAPSIQTDYPRQQVAASAPLSSGSGGTQLSGFPSPPSDSRGDCDDANSPFVQWINTVQQRASSGGACLNSRGAYLINSEGARKSRYCAQFYSGTEREQSMQQAVEYDRVAAEAQETMRGTCG
ncbi:hypothetical protein QTL95_00245 [Rhizobium sp. S152]|uniref:hypothetical protein n=1 Tax=Rhizobium sp. S152 TaxID=3055038 RepID=UPI0025A97A62|nr:hypothetical protein [Rhizobium sp. S152]MDM9624305.1 hypothetical protein [Rhizobium sp. S152]